MAKFDFKYKVRMQFKPGVYVQFYPGVCEVPDEHADHPYLLKVAVKVVEPEPAPEPVAEPAAPVTKTKG